MNREDLLQEAAVLAYAEAPALCTENPVTGQNCLSLHQLWPALRLLGLVMSAELHAEFFARALRGALHSVKASPRFLISGACDHALLAIALAAMREAERAARITVIDRCETPLLLNRWYAAKQGIEVQTTCQDILALDDVEGFDALCTHSFLGFFTPDQRDRMAAKWLQLLRPGGYAITVNRLRTDPARGEGFGPGEAQRFAEEVRRRAEKIRQRMPAGADEVAHLAARQAALRGTAYAVRSEAELRETFERAGFVVEHLASEALPAEVQTRLWGRSVPGDAPYAKLILRKPGPAD